MHCNFIFSPFREYWDNEAVGVRKAKRFKVGAVESQVIILRSQSDDAFHSIHHAPTIAHRN